MMMKARPTDVDLSSASDSSSSEDIKDDEKTSEDKKVEESKKEPQKEKPKTQLVFITFDAIPRTLKQFENMSKTWLGFPQALNQIGLKYEAVEKRLKAVKEPFDDEDQESLGRDIRRSLRS